MAASPRRLNAAITWFWLYLALFCAAMLVFRFWHPTATPHRFTYEVSQPTPGTLISDRWTWDFIVDGLFVLVWVIPITGALMTSFPLSSGARWFHIFVLLLLFAWFAVVFVWGWVDYADANLGTAENAENPANDPRWCCVYFNTAGYPACLNSVPCVPGVGPEMLAVDGTFAIRFWFNFVLLLLILFDLFYTVLVLRRTANVYAMRLRADAINGNSNVESKIGAAYPPTRLAGRAAYRGGKA